MPSLDLSRRGPPSRLGLSVRLAIPTVVRHYPTIGCGGAAFGTSGAKACRTAVHVPALRGESYSDTSSI